MTKWFMLAVVLSGVLGSLRGAEPAAAPAAQKVYVLPIRDDIMPPLVYVEIGRAHV